MSEETLTGPEVIDGVYDFLEFIGGESEHLEKSAIRKEYGDVMEYERATILSFGNEKNLFVFSLGSTVKESENYDKDILVARIDENFCEAMNFDEEGPKNIEERFAHIIETKNFISSSDFFEEGEVHTGLVGAFKDGRIVCSGMLRRLCDEYCFNGYMADSKSLWKPEIINFFIENMADLLTLYITQEKRRPRNG